MKEKDLLLNLNNKYLVAMKYFFVDDARIYFIMDLAEGGDLTMN